MNVFEYLNDVLLLSLSLESISKVVFKPDLKFTPVPPVSLVLELNTKLVSLKGSSILF